MLRGWRLTATVLGLTAGFAACAKGEVNGTLTSSTTSSSTGGSSTTTGSSSFLSSSGTGGATTFSSSAGTGGTGGSLCGNGMLDPGESCDGSSFGTTTCDSLGLGQGTLQCTSVCQLDVSGCEPAENCTNGIDDNQDGLVDCQDPQCKGMTGCIDSCLPTYPATLPGDVEGDNTGRPAVHHASCSSTPSGSEQIFSVTAQASGTMSLDFFAFDFANFSISVRTTCATDSSEIACNAVPDPDFGDLLLSVPVTMGQTYFVMVQGMTPQDVDQFDLELSIPLPETDCANLQDDDGNGYVDCDDASCQALPACVPGTTPTGQPCTANTTCTANHNDPICLDSDAWPNGYCSEFCDVTAQDCSAGNICYAGLKLSVNGVCLHECTLDTDCSAGYACADLGLSSKVCTVAPESACEDYVDNDFDGLTDCQDPTACQTTPDCTPGIKAAGQACVLHNECFANAGENNPFCLDSAHLGYPGGYCSHYCDPTLASDCGPNGICVPEGPNGENICMQTCTANAQCRSSEGYTCQGGFGFGKKICTF